MTKTITRRAPAASGGAARTNAGGGGLLLLRTTLRRVLAPQPSGGLLLLSLGLVAAVTLLLRHLQAALVLYDGLGAIRPFGIGYLAPIMLMTALGGRRAGFVTLILSCAATALFLTVSAPAGAARSQVEIGLLALTGVFAVTGLGAVRERASMLTDLTGTPAGDEITRQVRDAVAGVGGGLRIQACLVRRRGFDLYVDVDVAVADDPPQSAIRALTDRAEQAVSRSNPLIFQARVRAH